jgi:Ca-activated chloride channel homolog
MLSDLAEICRTTVAVGLLLACGSFVPHTKEDKAAPCRDDAMIVFDASGSMSGNQTLVIPNSHVRIDEVRYALVC